jgi:hypothetical protein
MVQTRPHRLAAGADVSQAALDRKEKSPDSGSLPRPKLRVKAPPEKGAHGERVTGPAADKRQGRMAAEWPSSTRGIPLSRRGRHRACGLTGELA